MNELELVKEKLHLMHNNYTLALTTARQYQRWLTRRVRPCLTRNVARCLRVVEFGISLLLRLCPIATDEHGSSHSSSLRDPLLLSEDSEEDLVSSPLDDELVLPGSGPPEDVDDAFRRKFPFDTDLVARAGEEALQPDKVVVSHLTFNQVQHL